MREVYNTEQVRGPDAFEYVRDALANSPVPLEVAGGRPVIVRARSQIVEFGDVSVSIVRSVSDTEFTLRRTPEMIRRSDPEAYRLVMAPEGRLRHGERPYPLRFKERDLALYDTSREFESWRRPGLQTSQLVVVTVPRDLIGVQGWQVAPLLGEALPPWLRMHQVTGRLLAAIGARPHIFESLDPQPVRDTLISLVDGLVADRLHLPVPADTVDRARLLLVQAVIVEHAHDPRFATAAIARHLHESGRTLRNSARRRNTSLKQLLTDARLAQANLTIADPAHQRQALASIAPLCGFGSHEVMTRTMVAHQGRVPSSLRPRPSP
ncbi:hypothetical protein K1W54_12565 [Micromonospora sp. CPCC 205371]|nr:hypothetical protein [Micromonospora sp. CPCC 205371]